MDHTKVIYKNKIAKRTIRKAERSKRKYQKKFGDDSNQNYQLKAEEIPVLHQHFPTQNLSITDGKSDSLPENAVIIGNIRMGFGHYRISMAMASCAKALGYQPYWLDLCSLEGTTCSKIISHQNDLYSMGSRLSQRFSLFNKLVWEPMNSEGFRQLSYNAVDQKNSELMTPVLQSLPKDIPYIATHVWPAQAAVHAEMTHVVNAIPDNWPMALHLAEGSIHTVQTPSSYLGYLSLRGMDKKKILSPMDTDSLVYTGHYVDHELVSNLEQDNAHRKNRIQDKKARRYLLTVGGAGAQKELFAQIIRSLLPEIKKNKAVLFLNVGDHKNVWEELLREIPQMKTYATEHFEDFSATENFVSHAYEGEVTGIHAFYHKDIFAAVYSTNLLMRVSDILVTKPSELSFYPIPKLMIRRVGGHEAWGAIRSAEVGDGTFECEDATSLAEMLNLIQNEDAVLNHIISCIETAHQSGVYNGAYEVVKLATASK